MKITHFFLFAGFICCTFISMAQTHLWSEADPVIFRSSTQERWVEPQKYRLVHLDVRLMEGLLEQIPERFNPENKHSVLQLPMPDGTFQSFAITNAPLLHPELRSKYPEIKTFAGQGLDNPAAAIYLDWAPQGFHAMILSPGQIVYVDPFLKNDSSTYISYNKTDFNTEKTGTFSCGTEQSESSYQPSHQISPVLNDRSSMVSLRTYRMAMAATGEFTTYHGGTVGAALAAITTTLNRVRGIYETELGISFTLVSNNDQIIYTNSATDPYSNPPTVGENQTNIDAVIGTSNYDIGHVVNQGSGSIATLNSVCVTSSKARGVTSLSNPVGDPFDVDYIAHEIGHQFGARHTFNSNTGSCNGANRVAATAYEPGSGSTIMAYPGLCSTQNLQFRGHAYFHRVSLDEITTFVTSGSGSTCPDVVVTGNSSPTVNADPLGMNGKTIPMSTPFELTASGSDPDGNPLTYSWEQWDLGDEGAPSSSRSNGPVFRSFPPVSSPTRAFPRLSKILENTSGDGEFLPSVSRDLNFKCTVRDNLAGGGGNATGSLMLSVTNAAGPFSIFSHNTSATLNGNITVLWNVANTTAAPVNCANVDILISLDGGASFTPMLSNTPNDGSQTVTLPNIATGQARIKVKCSDNVFFDINNADLRIAPEGATCGELFTNGNMEAGGAGWTQSSTNDFDLIGSWGTARSGSSSAWLGYENNETSRISQTIAIPADALFANLEFWYKLERFDCGGDLMRVKVNGVTVSTHNLCDDPGVAGWTRRLVDLSAYKGTSPTVMIETVNNGRHPSDFFIDDVSVYVCSGEAFLLPVELLSFNAQAEGREALLTWTTASERNNDGFEIEMRSDKTEFQEIGFVKGAGNTTSPTAYRHIVPHLEPGIYYFRLRQMDTDGTANLSPVRTVTVAGSTHVSVEPNPASGVAHFVLLLEQESELKLEVIDLTGRIIGTVTEGGYATGKYRVSFGVGELPSGVYFYRLKRNNQGDETGRFFISK